MLIPLHGIASRHDLPLPFSFVVTGAALALVLSFVVLFLAWRSPRFVAPGGVTLGALGRAVDSPVLRWTARLVIHTVYLWAGLALLAGPDLLTNPIFGFIFVWMWVGVVPLSIALGPFWRETNPLRTIHLGLCALARVDPDQGLARLGRRVGVWPAAAALFCFGWLELIEPDRTTLAVIRVWALAWLVLLILGSVVFGQHWIGAADP